MSHAINNYIVDSTVPIGFTTKNRFGANQGPNGDFDQEDIRVYKGSIAVANRKATANGITVQTNVDGNGVHNVNIDTSNDTGDAGFWVEDGLYIVLLSPNTETIDGQVVCEIIERFRLPAELGGGGGGGFTDDDRDKLCAIQNSTNTLGSCQVQVLNPVGNGCVVIVQGDSYLLANGRALDFAMPSGGNWPTDLTGWDIEMVLTKSPDNEASGAASLVVSGTVVTATGANRTVRFEPTADDTDDLAPGVAAYEVAVKAASGTDRATLFVGVVNVIEDQVP